MSNTLSPEQLTGRARSHVRDFEAPHFTLQPAAAAAFLQLRQAAASAGLDLIPLSSFRDFEHQCRIWNGKFSGARPLQDRDGQRLDVSQLSEEQIVRAILHWSAVPGASRHHWGTDIDVIDQAALPPGQRPQLEPAEYAAGGVFARLDQWLSENCSRSGFFRPYDLDRGGVQPEPWHLSYAPLAHPALAALTPTVLAAAVEAAELAGQATLRRWLPQIHAQYVQAVARPSALALAHRPPAAPDAPGLAIGAATSTTTPS